MADPRPAPADGDELAAAYAFALRRHARAPSEHGLQTAYELGRTAVRRQHSLLDLALAHHAALLASLRAARDAEHVARITGAAADFLVESLSAFEMQGRGFRETQEVASTERRHAEMIRRLSTFLTEASRPDGPPASEAEILQLVAEQARELTGAATCVVSVRRPRSGRLVRACSSQPLPAGPAWAASDWAPMLAALEPEADDVDALTAPMPAADGRTLGELRVTRSAEQPFGAVDAAVLVHLAQMTAAALERVWRGAPTRPPRAPLRRRVKRVRTTTPR